MYNNIRLYQFGNFVFPTSNQDVERNLGVKNKLDSTDYTDAKIRVNKFNKDFTEDTFYEISFLSTEYTNDELDSVFYSKPQKIFFVEKFETNNSDGDYRVYFAYASVYSTSNLKLNCSENPFDYQITLRQISRRYLIQDNRLKFIKKTDLLEAIQGWEVDNNTNWEQNDNINWEDKYNGKALNFNQLTSKQRLDLFDCCSESGFFDYEDLFLRQEVLRIDTSHKNYIEINLSSNDATNSQVLYSTQQNSFSLNTKSTAENKTVIFEIEKDGIAGALENGQYIEVLNNKTQSGFRITCNKNFCPPFVSIFTHKRIKLYNTNNNQAINYLNPKDNQNYLKWKIERIGNSSTFFALSNSLSIYSFFGSNDVDFLLIKRNFSGNLKIRIANLPTFY